MKSFSQDYLDKLVISPRIITMIRKLGEHKGKQGGRSATETDNQAFLFQIEQDTADHIPTD